MQFLLKLIISGCFEPLKKDQISNFFKITLKKWENLFGIVNFSFIWWATLLNNSSYEPHRTYFSGFTFLWHLEGPKKPQSILSLSSRWWNSLPGACSDLDLGKKNYITVYCTVMEKCTNKSKHRQWMTMWQCIGGR